MKLFEEELLEPVARYFRFHAAVDAIEKDKEVKVADLGCGPKIRFYHYARKNNIQFEKYFGVDPLLAKSVLNEFKKEKDITLINDPMDTKIPLKTESVDYLVGFAFLEHIDHPDKITQDAIRVLKPGGKAVFTTPSHMAKGVLEFLSFKLGLISPREIEEHKNYFNKEDLEGLLTDAHKKKVEMHHQYFEFGLNNLFILQKK